MSKKVTVDMNNAQRMQDEIGKIFTDQRSVEVLVALTMVVISTATSVDKPFEKVLVDIARVEQQLKVEKE